MEELREYLNDFVDPAITEFNRNPTSVRHAFTACVVTFHAVDYLAHPRSPRTLRQQWNKQSPAFAIVDKVAHAFKHVKSGDPTKPKLRAREVVAVSGVFDSAVFDAEVFDVGGVTLENDPTVDILAVVKKAVAFVRGQLKPTE